MGDNEMAEMGVYYAASSTPNNITATLSYGSQNLSTGAGNRGSMGSKPNNSTLIAGFLNREQERESTERCAVYRKRGSIVSKVEQDQRATFPSRSSPETVISKEIGSSLIGLRPQISPESLNNMTLSPNKATSSKVHRPNSSLSSGNLSTNRNTNRSQIITERKSKSEERQTSHDNDAFDNVTTTETPISLLSTSLPSTTTQTSATFLDATSNPSPPKIPINRKVIIVDHTEVYDCLDLGRRIDVMWPSESMRLSGIAYLQHYSI